MARKALEVALALVVGIWVARHLGPERYGILSYALAFVGLFAPMAGLGLGSVLARDLVLSSEPPVRLLGSALLLRATGALGLAGVVYLAIRALRPGDTEMIAFVVILAASHLLRVFGFLESWFQARVQSKYSVLASAIASLSASGVRVVLILKSATLVSFVLIAALEPVLAAFLLLFFYVRTTRTSIARWRFDAGVARRLLADSWPLTVAAVVSLGYTKLDRVLIGQLIGDRNVGVYAVAANLSGSLQFLSNFVLVSVFPSLLRAREKSRELYLQRFQSLYDGFVWLSIGTCTVLALFADPIIRLLYGAAYAPAAAVFAVHVWSSVFLHPGAVGRRYLLAENLTRQSLFMTCGGAAINLAANFVLVPRLGIVGAAWAALLSYAVSHWLSAGISSASRPVLWFFVRALNPIAVTRRWRRLLQ
jgi:PST family polysaccharide transporter